MEILTHLTLTDILLATVITTLTGANIIETLTHCKPMTKIRKAFFKDIHNELAEIKEQSKESEKLLMRNRIVDFATDLRNGEFKSEVQYTNIYECYDKYHKLGGNSYIDEEIAFIKEIHKKSKK